MPACSIVEEKARTANLHHIHERVTVTCQRLVQPGQQPGKFVPLGGAVALREMRKDSLDGITVHASKGMRPRSPRGHIICQGLLAGVEQSGEISHGDGFRRNQPRAPGLGLVQEQLDDTTAGTPSRKDDGGGPEVGQWPLDVVLDEVGRGGRKRGFVPSEEHTFNGVCQDSVGFEGKQWVATRAV